MAATHRRSTATLIHLDSPVRIFLGVLFAFILSYLAARLGHLLLLRPQMIWPFWPGCAFLVAILLLTRRKIWPALLVAGLAGFALYDLQAGLTIRSTVSFLLADTIEILVAAIGVSYAFNGMPRLNSLSALLKYSLFAVILAPTAVASVAASTLGGDYRVTFRVGFFTEALALLTLTPAILSWASISLTRVKRPVTYYLEAMSILIGLAVLCYVTLVASGNTGRPALLFSLVPFLLWSALRFGIAGTSALMIVVGVFSSLGAIHGRGPFTGGAPINNVFALQLFLLFGATSFMVLAAVVEEDKEADNALHQINRTLEGQTAVLQAREDLLKIFVKNVPAGVAMLGRDMRYLQVSDRWCADYGVEASQVLGRSHYEVFPDVPDRWREVHRRALEGETLRADEDRWDRAGGVTWVRWEIRPWKTPTGSIGGILIFAEDITHRKQAEEALRASEERLRLAQQAARIGSFERDIRTGVVTWTTQMESMYGVLPGGFERSQTAFLNLIHPDDRARVADLAEQALKTGQLAEGEWRVVWADGSVRWIAGRWQVLMDETGELSRVVGVNIDVTERKKAEEALASLSGRLIEAQEEERKRIARELHDDYNQRLALLAIDLEKLAENEGDDEAAQQLYKFYERVTELGADMHSLSHSLHSSTLENLGLVAGVRAFCAEFAEQQGIQVDFSHENVPCGIPADAALCLFRIVQEGLRNVKRHSGGNRAEVRLKWSGEKLHLSVADRGRGFDPSQPSTNHGIGIRSMEERLRLLGGQLEIYSTHMAGTRVDAWLPFGVATQRAV